MNESQKKKKQRKKRIVFYKKSECTWKKHFYIYYTHIIYDFEKKDI